jgi:hypothetical protein
MSRNSCGLFTLCLLAGAWIAPLEAQADDPDPIIEVRVEMSRALDGINLLRAQQLTTEIYEQAGVTLVWTTEAATPGRSLSIVLTTMATAPAGLVPESMGVAPSPGDGSRGTTAYIFMDRVASFTATHRVAGEYVLACALAHEIGHLLLPPNAHAAEGIMRGNWHPALFPPRAPGVPGFAPEQARLLRIRAQSRQ